MESKRNEKVSGAGAPDREATENIATTQTREIKITKAEYQDDSDDWQEKLNKKYGVDDKQIVDSQRNFDGKKYTYDLWLRRETNPKIKLKVEDARGDKYQLNFDVENTDDGLALICPWCGERLNPYTETACANGHIAYTIIDEEAEQKAIDAITEA
jgi:hypothetical protein